VHVACGMWHVACGGAMQTQTVVIRMG